MTPLRKLKNITGGSNIFLSRIEINQFRRETMRALSSPQVMHAAVAASFPPTKNAVSERILWRIDKIGSAVFILIQSNTVPDFTHIVEQFGWPASGQRWETYDMEQFLQSIEKGQVWRFRLKANPVHSVKCSDKDSRGKVFAHVTIEQQKDWFLSRVQKYGFSIAKISGEDCFEIKQTTPLKFERQGSQITIYTATFEGVLVIEDKEQFINTIKTGIGRAKAYGCGLLTIARLQ